MGGATMRIPLKSLLFLFIAFMAIAQGASATVVTYTFGDEFSGSGSTLSGNVVVTIDDGGGTGSVDITVDTNDLDGSLFEFITGLYLNLDPALDPNAIVASDDGTDPDATYSFGTDAFMADGDGLYDILIGWPSGPPSDRLTADMIDTFTFTLLGLTASSFEFLSTPAGGHGPFEAALRAQGLGPQGQGSGWFSPDGGGDEDEDVPEPATFTLIGLGLFALGLRHRRR